MIVSADGKGLVSQSGGLLLTRTLAATGLDRGLSAGLARWRPARAVHDPGKIIADLAVTLALGGDCLADIALLRAEPGLFGPVASGPVVSRLVARLATDAPRALKAIRAARAAARQRAWHLAGQDAPGADGGPVIVDLDATIVIAHSGKDQAAPTWKKTYGLFIRWPRSPTTARKGPGNRWPSCSGPATPGRTPPPTTSRRPASRSRNCRPGSGRRRCSAPAPRAALMTS
jgi:hypothetical protein